MALDEDLKLERHERRLIHRRRAGLSQRTVADSMGIPLAIYIEWEQHRGSPADVDEIPPVEDATEYEIMWMQRRRFGMTQEQLAEKCHYTRQTINRVERGLVASRPPIEAMKAVLYKQAVPQ
jgi:DNA-binding XRE family transcriptional regulator